ncbi:Fic family protein [Spiroplasma gladiatoris]|uniref:Fic family protein n=1 Tax=Spiroplasma gladiatoris TaxID=2143 RepID=A0A4V1AQ52_9MOLU|nr:Fic family protein [Spiroplasma gladiatoris]QBQ07289.1 Fic family protein [Spiroplasma gladiatoris]
MKFNKWYFEQAYLKNAHSSARIEANKLSLKSFEKIIFDNDSKSIWENISEESNEYDKDTKLKWYEEALGFKKAYSFLYYEVHNNPNQELDLSIIKKIHFVLTENINDFNDEDKGKFRTKEIYISNACVKSSHSTRIESDLIEVLDEYNQRKQLAKTLKEKIQALAFLHAAYEIIHPFIDGNGRSGRMIITLESLKMGLFPISFNYQNQHLYYLGLQKVSLSSDPVSNNIFKKMAKNNFSILEALMFKSFKDNLNIIREDNLIKGYMNFDKVNQHIVDKKEFEKLNNDYKKFLLDETIATYELKALQKQMRADWVKKYDYVFKD